MRRTIASLLTAAIVLIAAPAFAEECATLEIGHDEQTAYIEERISKVDGIRFDIVGEFLWVNYGDQPGMTYETTVSVDVSDETVTGATVCPDGAVSLHHAEPLVEAVETPGEDEVVDLADVYADYQPFIDALLRFRPY